MINLYFVKFFGEFEYWFFFIKVVSIVFFLFLGIVIICGFILGIDFFGIFNFLYKGGFLLNGISFVFLGIVFVMFFFMGIEIVVIVVGELF